jgi:hypothetical protein
MHHSDDMKPRPRRLTRAQLLVLLNESGYPIGESTLDKMCAPSVATGPPVAAWWGNRPLYDPDQGLAWAEARVRSSRRDGMPGEGRP